MKAKNFGEDEHIRILIVDDEFLARKRVKDLLLKYEGIKIVSECRNGKEAIKAIQDGIADLLFLDIQMRDINGFEILESVNLEVLPMIIFVTAYDKYALKAFEFHAVDYLLKPFDDERFEEMMEHAQKQLKKNQIETLSEKLNDLLIDYQKSEKNPQKNVYQERLVIKSSGKVQFVNVEDIDWIGAEGSYVSININGKTHLMRETLKKLDTILNPSKFLRIHRSTIINISRVKELHSHFHGEFIVVLHDGKRLKLSRSYRENAEHLLGGNF